MRLVSLLLLVFLLSGCQNLMPLPEGISYQGKPRIVQDIKFLADLTYVDERGQRHTEQEIFDELFGIIAQARRFILLDVFLYNDFQGAGKETTRALSGELTSRLIRQKKKHPDIQIIVITDPINTVYGGLPSKQFAALRQAGIKVVITELDALRDSNPAYSLFWRLFAKPFGNSEGGLLPNPFGEGEVSARSYLRLLNFKANHRKVLIADSEDEFVGMVTSANPHDGSSAHGNVAVKFTGPAVSDLLATEKAVLAFSGVTPPAVELPQTATHKAPPHTTLQVLTEGKIKQVLLQTLQAAQAGDNIDLSMFYLSDRAVINALKQARQRGVATRILLDPNKDAFGRSKNGIPNRQVAYELSKAGLPVRWCDTHGEQCHAKILISRKPEGTSTVILGSANFTRRNLDDLNLETNIAARGQSDARFFQETQAYFDLVWHNKPGQHFSVDYEKYADHSLFKRILYRFMETSGISTF